MQAVLSVVRRDPRQFGLECSRWRLADLIRCCPFLHLGSVPGMHQLLERLGIAYKHGRQYVHSPDPAYQGKLAYLRECWQLSRAEPGRYVFLYQDEFTCYRQPSLARDYEARGRTQPYARLSYSSNSYTRVLGSLDAGDGTVLYLRRHRLDTHNLVAFYEQVASHYSDAECIYVTLDNWPVHYHPDVMAALVPQSMPHPPSNIPANWPTEPSKKARRLYLPIQLVPLPTYASWLNPIEKLWRKLKQELLHLHRLANDWSGLAQAIEAFLDRFAGGSADLLRYVGLLPH
jgi:transposase